MDCVSPSLGGPVTHLATVPSTRGRPGPHPLRQLLGARLRLPAIEVTASTEYGGADRELHPDWFTVTPPDRPGAIRALLLDDTWTSGSRAQSLAHSLKSAGVDGVAVVVLGRHVNPEDSGSAALLSAIAEPMFDINRCAAEDRA